MPKRQVDLIEYVHSLGGEVWMAPDGIPFPNPDEPVDERLWQIAETTILPIGWQLVARVPRR